VVVSTEKYNPEKIDVLYNVLDTGKFAFDEARAAYQGTVAARPEQIVIAWSQD